MRNYPKHPVIPLQESGSGPMSTAQKKLAGALGQITSAPDAVWAIVAFLDAIGESLNDRNSSGPNSPYLAWRRASTLISEAAGAAGIETPPDPAAAPPPAEEIETLDMFTDLDLEDR